MQKLLLLIAFVFTCYGAQAQDTLIYQKSSAQTEQLIMNTAIMVTKPYDDLYRDVVMKDKNVKDIVLRYPLVNIVYAVVYKGPAIVGRKEYDYVEIVEVRLVTN